MRPWIFLIVALVGMAASNVWLTSTLKREHLTQRGNDQARAGWTLGDVRALANSAFWETRRSLAIITWTEAQTYFHRGFDLSAFSRNHEMEQSAGREHHHDEAEEGPRVHSEEEEKQIQSLENHPFLHESLLRPYVFKHSHMKMGEVEMMPWYWLTTKLDPNFVRAYTNGAYWLGFHFHKPDQALDYVNRGIQENPAEYPLYDTRAHILFSLKNAPERAARDYEHAIALNPDRTLEEHGDLLESYRFLARAYLDMKQYEKALEVCYRAKREDRDIFGLDIVIADATKALEGQQQ